MKFRKKPAVIEAIEWSGLNVEEMEEFAGSAFGIIHSNFSFEVVTLEDTMRAEVGDFIIKGVKGEFYPCKPDIFEMTYEKLNS